MILQVVTEMELEGQGGLGQVVGETLGELDDLVRQEEDYHDEDDLSDRVRQELERTQGGHHGLLSYS